MNQSIQNGLNDLFDQIIPISRDFNKKTYADSFKNAYEKYKPLFTEIAQECENSEDRQEEIEEIAAVLPDRMREVLDQESSKRKKEKEKIKMKTEIVRNEMIKAMKNKDKRRKDALSMLLTALKNAEIDAKGALDETNENVVIKKEMKQLQETYDSAPDYRNDIKEDAEFRISVCKEFLPEDMTEDQIMNVINETLKELDIKNPSGKDKGVIMKNLMPKVKGKADGKLVNQMIMKILA